MGDRANVCIRDGESTVYLYTHWAGSELPQILRDALACDVARGRWNDGPYLARIIFCRMLPVGKELFGATGYGISAVCGDGDKRILLVDVDAQRVGITDEFRIQNGAVGCVPNKPDASWSFEEFAALEGVTWQTRN